MISFMSLHIYIFFGREFFISVLSWHLEKKNRLYTTNRRVRQITSLSGKIEVIFSTQNILSVYSKNHYWDSKVLPSRAWLSVVISGKSKLFVASCNTLVFFSVMFIIMFHHTCFHEKHDIALPFCKHWVFKLLSIQYCLRIISSSHGYVIAQFHK